MVNPSLPRPDFNTHISVNVETRSLLPIYPPPEPLDLPPLPTPARRLPFHAPYTLSTHIIPAAFLRTTRAVPVPEPPPANFTKSERQEFMLKTQDKLFALRGSKTTDGYPQVLWNCLNRYVRDNLDGSSAKGPGITMLFTHANGFPKEIWEPTLKYLFSSQADQLIDEVWTWESVQHGDACVINAKALSGIFDWADNTRDILNFLFHYLPETPSSTPLPTHLPRLPISHSEQRRKDGFYTRKLVAVGHSYGGCTSALAALTYPKLFSSLVLVDPVIIYPVPPGQKLDPRAGRLILGALMRRESWKSKEEAYQSFKQNPFFSAWDPEVLKIYVECGIYSTTDANGLQVVKLKMPGVQEAIVFSEIHTRHEVYVQMSKLDERIPIRWVLPAEDQSFGPPPSAQKRVWLRTKNSSNVMIPGSGHLIPQERPKVLAHDLCDFLLKHYSSIKQIKSNL